MLLETKILLDRAAPLERAGQWQQAIDLCFEVFSQSIFERNSADLIEAVLRAGLCYRQMGKRELAEEHLDLALTLAELHSDKGRAGRALNGLATLHHVHGALQEAGSCYSRAEVLARDVGDMVLLGNIKQNLGVLAVIRGDRVAALKHYQAALDCYRSIRHERGMAGVLNNLGMLHIDLGQIDAAATLLEEALGVCRTLGDAVTEGLVHTNRTEMFIKRGELASARTSCDEAFEIFSRLGEHSGRSEALKAYGIIYRETQKYYLAETHLTEAIDVASTHNYPLEEAEAYRELSLVLRAQERNREALQALNRAHELFTRLQAKQAQADIAGRISKLESDFLSLVRAWGESIEAKDQYTSGHCQRVADYACRIAEQIGMSEQDLIWFRMGAFLHDVGKTEVPAEILNKPGKLTVEEREIMERHTIIGDRMLSSIEFPWDIRPMVRSHHERWDGNGYPDGLCGEEIPLTARILRIADIFDALTTTRSYREPLTPSQAYRIMEDDTGGFDPRLFEVFSELFPEFVALSTLGDSVGEASDMVSEATVR